MLLGDYLRRGVAGGHFHPAAALGCLVTTRISPSSTWTWSMRDCRIADQLPISSRPQ